MLGKFFRGFRDNFRVFRKKKSIEDGGGKGQSKGKKRGLRMKEKLTDVKRLVKVKFCIFETYSKGR